MKENKKHVCILSNELNGDEESWVRACDKLPNLLTYEVVNLTMHNWVQRVTSRKYDLFISKPPGLTAPFKQLYDERIFIIDTVLKQKVYPSPLEIYIYENKRFFYSWLGANNLPHPETKIFYSQDEALTYLGQTEYPIVAKANIGASGSGVHILHSQADADNYARQSFTKGVPKRWGPNLKKGGLLKRGSYYLLHPNDIRKKLSAYKAVKNDKQIGFILLQQYIPHEFEWRIVVIGDSFFAHKKLKIDDKASGSLLKSYENPPLRIFDFARELVNRLSFYSQAIDVFESPEGEFIINEMQCIFGQSDPYQMLVDGNPGRYRFLENKWVFEAGDFNTNQSYDLRLKHAISMIDK